MLHESEELSMPDWSLIDEISIPLLREGVGDYDILQRALPSIVLANCDRINDELTESRLLKLFQIAQLQLQYVLRSQNSLLQKLTLEKSRYTKTRKEHSRLKRVLTRSPPAARELYRCDECAKIFLHSTFLIDHLIKRHGQHHAALMAPTPLIEDATRYTTLNDQTTIVKDDGHGGGGGRRVGGGSRSRHTSPKTTLSSASSNTSVWR